MKIFLFHFFSPNPTPDYSIFNRYFSDKGHDVLLSNMTEEGMLSIESGQKKKTMAAFPWKLRRAKPFNFFLKRIAFLVFIIRVRRIIKKENPDFFVIAPCELMYVGLLPLFMPRKIKFIYDLRQLGLSPGSGLKPRINNIRAKYTCRLLTKFVFDHTCFAYEDAAVHFFGKGYQQKKCSVMEVGVDDRFNALERKVQVEEGKLKLVYAGALARVRKLEFIFEAIDQLRKTETGFHLTFVGHDEDNHYHQLLDRMGLHGFISILDPVPYTGVPALLNKFDAAVAYVPAHPDWEFQPTLKVREYVACGIPVIATRNRPNADFVKENVNGFLIGNTVEDFCKAAGRLCAEPGLLQRMNASALNMRKGFTWDAAAANYETLFKKLSLKT